MATAQMLTETKLREDGGNPTMQSIANNSSIDRDHPGSNMEAMSANRERSPPNNRLDYTHGEQFE